MPKLLRLGGSVVNPLHVTHVEPRDGGGSTVHLSFGVRLEDARSPREARAAIDAALNDDGGAERQERERRKRDLAEYGRVHFDGADGGF